MKQNQSNTASQKKSTLDIENIDEPIAEWLKSKFDYVDWLEIRSIDSPVETGMSSETLFVEFYYCKGHMRQRQSLVFRLAPRKKDFPVFPVYDLELQFKVMQIVSKYSAAPLPMPRWLELDSSFLGTPFFVMDRFNGNVPSDSPPYIFGGWMMDATTTQIHTLQDSTIDAIVELHTIDVEAIDVDFLTYKTPGSTALQKHFAHQRIYYAWVTSDGITHPLIERLFDWLDKNWPEEEGQTVISWGDSRISNVIYQDFNVSALLDWEMASLGPRELDIGWLCYMHSFFQNYANNDLPGLPYFLRLKDVTDRYSKVSGYRLKNIEWYFIYAALRHCIIVARIARRSVAFGQYQWTSDVDDCIDHRNFLTDFLDGKIKIH